MNSIYIVMSSPVGDVYEQIERIFSDQASAEKYAEYLKRIDDSFGQYEYYVVEHKIFDHFDETAEEICNQVEEYRRRRKSDETP